MSIPAGTDKKLESLLQVSDNLARQIHEVIGTVRDYDLERILKKIDADLADIRHSLTVAKRLCEQ